MPKLYVGQARQQGKRIAAEDIMRTVEMVWQKLEASPAVLTGITFPVSWKERIKEMSTTAAWSPDDFGRAYGVPIKFAGELPVYHWSDGTMTRTADRPGTLRAQPIPSKKDAALSTAIDTAYWDKYRMRT